MSQNQNTKVIVTGAAGYIGGAICIELKKQGYYVIGVDRRYTAHLKPYYDEFVLNDFYSMESLALINEHKPNAIIHCAGTSLVGPSVTNPALYYSNNVAKTSNYLNHLRLHSPATKFIFSSSASVYGYPDSTMVFEGSKTDPMSPYGESKLMTEMMLRWFNFSYGTKYVSFRYFNACGAISNIHGQEPAATHIFARIIEAGLTGEPFHLNGGNYPTKDGTCVRDYVHIADIAKAHIIAIDNPIEKIYNIGSGKGYSNLEIFDAVEKYLLDKNLIKEEIPVIVEEPRAGDPAILVASYAKLNNDTGWKPELGLDEIIEDLYKWYTSEDYIKQKRS